MRQFVSLMGHPEKHAVDNRYRVQLRWRARPLAYGKVCLSVWS